DGSRGRSPHRKRACPNACVAARASSQLSMPRCSEWRDFAFLQPSEPGAKALDGKLLHDLHDAKPLSELRNESWKSADGVAPCDRLSSHCDVFSPKSFPWRVAAEARRLAEPSKAQ